MKWTVKQGEVQDVHTGKTEDGHHAIATQYYDGLVDWICFRPDTTLLALKNKDTSGLTSVMERIVEIVESDRQKVGLEQ